MPRPEDFSGDTDGDLYLVRDISPISPHISPISRLHLPCTSPAPRLHLPCTSPARPLHQVCWDAEILEHVSRHARPRPLANTPQPPATPPETKRGVSQRNPPKTPHGCTEGCEKGCRSADEDGCKSADAPRLGDDWLESAQVGLGLGLALALTQALSLTLTPTLTL